MNDAKTYELQVAGLTRQLGLSAAVAVIVGETIGVGIFLTPAGMARDLGAPFWLLLVWLIMALMALCGALCYGELAARRSQSCSRATSRSSGQACANR